MKKFLGIVVLGLLWCNIGVADGNNLRNTLLNSDLVLKYKDGSIHTNVNKILKKKEKTLVDFIRNAFIKK